ncbi:metallophosphoesterase family protein [Pseudonocardia phyllosphaerae]|uniref:metallophosphoesterase family protein n=1 Tax=Pseudonocardia phyllosphaerae TaxID=3390502 RepID=UPI00397C34CC
MTSLVLISDTHFPARGAAYSGGLPGPVWDAVDAADVVVHAGDWCTADLLDRVEARSARLLACWGNNDGDDLRARLPETARATIGGVRVAVTHETGPKQGREARARRAHPDTDLLIFGHSHIPWDTTDDGLRLLNPGSPTDRRRMPTCTFMTLTLHDGRIGDVELHHL